MKSIHSLRLSLRPSTMVQTDSPAVLSSWAASIRSRVPCGSPAAAAAAISACAIGTAVETQASTASAHCCWMSSNSSSPQSRESSASATSCSWLSLSSAAPVSRSPIIAPARPPRTLVVVSRMKLRSFPISPPFPRPPPDPAPESPSPKPVKKPSTLQRIGFSTGAIIGPAAWTIPAVLSRSRTAVVIRCWLATLVLMTGSPHLSTARCPGWLPRPRRCPAR